MDGLGRGQNAHELHVEPSGKGDGKSKSSISRAIDTGRLSANRNGNLFEIDASELHRVFPLKFNIGGVPLNGPKMFRATIWTAPERVIVPVFRARN